MKTKLTLLMVVLLSALAYAETTWQAAEETPTAAGTVLVDNDAIVATTTYATTLKADARTIAGESFTHYIQVRINKDPSAENPVGVEQSGSTSILVEAKKDASLTIYYRRQSTGQTANPDNPEEKISGDFAVNDGKDVRVFDQANFSVLNGEMEIVETTADYKYGYATKTVELKAGGKYVICARGTTLQFYGFTVKAEEDVEPGGTVTPAIPTPVISPADGAKVIYGSEGTITYDDATYQLVYTTDGSDPKDGTNLNVINGIMSPETFTVDTEGTFVIKAYLEDFKTNERSETVTCTYTVEGGPVVINVGVPTFSPEPGEVEAGTKVMVCLGENAQSVTFTTNGMDPAIYGDTYPRNWPVVINEPTTIKAFCQDADGHKSETVEASYTIKPAEVLPESNVEFDPVDAMPMTFDSWNVSFLIKKTDTRVGDKFTFFTQPVEVEGWQWGPQVLPKNNADWSDLADALIPDESGKAVLTLTKDMANTINTNGGLRIQGMGVKVLAVQFEAGPTIEPEPEGEIEDLIDRFTYTWNGEESLTHNPDKSITYNGVSWGGLAAWLADNDVPVDWSGYEKLVFEFAEPTTVNVQGFVQTTTEDITYWGNPGLTKLECPFEGKDVSKVKQVALQLSDPATVVITKIYLVKKSGVEPAPEFVLTFDPKDGTEVEVDNQITLTFDEEAFLLYYTTDGSDPKAPESNVISAWGTGEKVTVKGEGNFVINAYLENRKTNAQSEVFTATYPIKAVAPFELTFDPKDGTEVEVDDQITLTFDEETFLLYYTTDGSDPKAPESDVISAWGMGEKVTVKGEGNFVINAYLENRKTNAQSEVFTATYPIKVVPAPSITFNPEDGATVEAEDEIILTFDDETYLCFYTVDGSDPKDPTNGNVISAWGNGEQVIVQPEDGQTTLTIKAYLENRKTNAQSEIFTATYNIKVDEPVVPEDVIIPTKANGYGTFCCEYDLDFSASDAKAYIARLEGNRVILSEIQKVPAGTGILVKSGSDQAVVPTTEGVAPFNGINDFIGVLEDTEVEYGTVSILSLVNGEEGFYKFLGTVIPANKAYFPVVASSASAKLSLIFEDADGINQIVNNGIVDGKAYNINGQRVKANYKGVVIVDGKKYYKK